MKGTLTKHAMEMFPAHIDFDEVQFDMASKQWSLWYEGRKMWFIHIRTFIEPDDVLVLNGIKGQLPVTLGDM